MEKKGNFNGLYLAGITGGIGLLISAVAFPFVSPALRKICLPYVPATTEQVQNVLKALKGQSKGTLVDLGSGDGRIVIAAAKKYGLRGTGVELNRVLVLYSRLYSIYMGVYPRTNFIHKDLWKVDLGCYQNVIIFGVEEMMNKLENKLCEELKHDSMVIACRFPLPSWTPIATFGEGINTVWLYKKPKCESSR